MEVYCRCVDRMPGMWHASTSRSGSRTRDGGGLDRLGHDPHLKALARAGFDWAPPVVETIPLEPGAVHTPPRPDVTPACCRSRSSSSPSSTGRWRRVRAVAPAEAVLPRPALRPDRADAEDRKST